MLVLQVKPYDVVRLVDNERGVPEADLKDIERLMTSNGMNRIFLKTPNPDTFHEYIIYNLCQMVIEHLKDIASTGSSDVSNYDEYSFVNSIFDYTSECFSGTKLSEFNISERKPIIDKSINIQDGSGKTHELSVCIYLLAAVNQ